MENTPYQAPSGQSGYGQGYGKKGSWLKWALIYLVGAVVVYGLVYYFVLSKRGNTYQTNTPSTQQGY